MQIGPADIGRLGVRACPGLPTAVLLFLSAGLTANTVFENRDPESRMIISTALAAVTVSDALLATLVSAAHFV
jgi:hypothetical protein